MSARSRIQRSIRRLDALDLNLSVPVVIAFGVTSLLLMVLYARIGMNLSLSTVVASGVFSTICACGVLLMLRPRVRSAESRALRGVIVISGLALASEVRAIVSLTVTTFMDGSQALESDVSLAVIPGFMLILMAFIGVVIAESAAHERRRLTVELQSEQAQLWALTDSLESDLAQAEVELRAQVHEQLAPTVSGITTLLESELSDADAHALSARISDAVASVVRPVSHSIAAGSDGALPPRKPTVPNRRHFLNDEVDVPKAVRPFSMLASMWLLMTPGMLLLRTPIVAITLFFAESVLAALLLVALLHAWPERWRRLNIPLGLTAILLVLIVANTALQVAIVLSGLGDVGPSWWEAISWLGIPLRVTFGMIFVIIGMLLDFGDQRRRELEEVNAQLTSYLAKLRREMWLLHRSVSLAVHGPVQSAMISTAMRLANPQRSATSLSDARRRLDLALTEISKSQFHSIDLAQRLNDLCSLWNPVVHVSYQIDVAQGSRLQFDSGLQSCVLEVCREAVSNAIRHGRATEVAMFLAESESCATVTVIDNGAGVSADAVPGLGHAALNEICLHWRIEPALAGGSILSATLV